MIVYQRRIAGLLSIDILWRNYLIITHETYSGLGVYWVAGGGGGGMERRGGGVIQNLLYSPVLLVNTLLLMMFLG